MNSTATDHMFRLDYWGILALFVFLLFLGSVNLYAYPVVETRDVTTELEDPVQMHWGPDDYLWIAERAGRVSRVHPETGDLTEILQVSDLFLPETRGILGMALHTGPADSTHVFLYYHYVHTHSEGWNIWGKVVRYFYDNETQGLREPVVILDSLQTLEWVIGGTLIALPDRTLLLSQGNGLSDNGNAQSLSSTLGKTLRFGFDGSAPADNPWTELQRPYNLIWTHGHRYVEGFAVGPSNRIYATDVGTDLADEVDLLIGGRDYGWGDVSGYCDNWPGPEDVFCAERNVVNPVYEWYRERRFNVRPAGVEWYPQGVVETWNNSLLVATYQDGLYQLKLRDDGRGVVAAYPFLYSHPDKSKHGPLRDVCVSPTGRIYVMSRGRVENEKPADKIFEILSTDFRPDTDGLAEIETQEVLAGLDMPGQIVCENDSVVWIAERSGAVSRVHATAGTMDRVADLSQEIVTGDEVGLLGLALHPDFLDSSYVYVSYTYGAEEKPQGIRAVRYQYNRGNNSLSDPRVLVEGIPAGETRNGGRLTVSKTALLMSVGDAGQGSNAQNLGNLAGSIVRIGLDGTVLSDNPYSGEANPRNVVWATGVGNPVEAVIPPSGLLYMVDAVQEGTVELNIAQSGGNYGWPLVEGFCSGPGTRFCIDSGAVDPIRTWANRDISGLAYYGSATIRRWNNSLLATSRDGQFLQQIQLSNDGLVIEAENLFLKDEFGRLSDVCVSAGGVVYIVTGNTEPGMDPSDRLIRINGAPDTSKGDQSTLRVRTVAEGLDTPWEVLWGPDNWLWITERRGVISRINPVSGEKRQLLDISEKVFEFAGSGMLGMTLHPEFSTSPYLYVVYTYNALPDAPGENTLERLERYRYDAASNSLIDPLVLIDSIEANIYHDGSRLLVLPDNTLLMATGDAANRSLPQDPGSLNGKMLRINLDGSIPADNPWAAAEWPSSLIWSTGHRNPQGLTLGPDNRIYSSEHGDDADDELNILYKGRNFGYPFVHGFCDDTVNYLFDPNERVFCGDSNVVEPIRSWTPTLGVCGLAYYDHDNIPEWKGSLLLATLGIKKPVLPLYANTLIQIKLAPDGETIEYEKTYFTQQFGRLRAVCTSPDGRVFLASSNEDTRGEPRPGGDRIIEITGIGDSNVTPPTDPQEELVVIPHPVLVGAVIDLGTIYERGTVEITDIIGAVVRSETFDGGNRWQFVRGDLSPGVYFVRVDDGKQSTQAKVVVQ